MSWREAAIKVLLREPTHQLHFSELFQKCLETPPFPFKEYTGKTPEQTFNAKLSQAVRDPNEKDFYRVGKGVYSLKCYHNEESATSSTGSPSKTNPNVVQNRRKGRPPKGMRVDTSPTARRSFLSATASLSPTTNPGDFFANTGLKRGRGEETAAAHLREAKRILPSSALARPGLLTTSSDEDLESSPQSFFSETDSALAKDPKIPHYMPHPDLIDDSYKDVIFGNSPIHYMEIAHASFEGWTLSEDPPMSGRLSRNPLHKGECQDVVVIKTAPDRSPNPYVVIVLADGHGGAAAANFFANEAATRVEKWVVDNVFLFSGAGPLPPADDKDSDGRAPGSGDKALETVVEEFFVTLFCGLDKVYLDNMSAALSRGEKVADDGATLTVCILAWNMLITANVGDSRAVLLQRSTGHVLFSTADDHPGAIHRVHSIRNAGGRWLDIENAQELKPDLSRAVRVSLRSEPYSYLKSAHVASPLAVAPLQRIKERKRKASAQKVEEAPPVPKSNNVFDLPDKFLNLGASMGDITFKRGPVHPVLSCVPTVSLTRIPTHSRCALVVASDGLWDYMGHTHTNTSHQMTVLADLLRTNQSHADDAIVALCSRKAAGVQQIYDDFSCVVAIFDIEKQALPNPGSTTTASSASSSALEPPPLPQAKPRTALPQDVPEESDIDGSLHDSYRSGSEALDSLVDVALEEAKRIRGESATPLLTLPLYVPSPAPPSSSSPLPAVSAPPPAEAVRDVLTPSGPATESHGPPSPRAQLAVEGKPVLSASPSGGFIEGQVGLETTTVSPTKSHSSSSSSLSVVSHGSVDLELDLEVVDPKDPR